LEQVTGFPSRPTATLFVLAPIVLIDGVLAGVDARPTYRL
jgi:hypothetical protein